MTPPTFSAGRTIGRLAKQIEVALAGLDLTLPQYRLLGTLGDGSSMASALADKLAVTKPSVTALVDGLVERGLVERHHDDIDRRRITHELTTAGRRLLTAAEAAIDGRLLDIAGHLDDGGEPPMLDQLEPWQRAMDAFRDAKLGAVKS